MIEACLLLLQLQTVWNVGTTLSLTAQRVSDLGGRMSITSIKERPDQIQDFDLAGPVLDQYSIREPNAVRALRLLIAHSKNVDQFGTRESASLFVTHARRGAKPHFALPSQRRHLLEAICRVHKINNFTYDSLRDQLLNLRYLESDNDPYVVKALANHSSLATTADYLDTYINRTLSAANINRYMQDLAHSVVFATGNSHRSSTLGINDPSPPRVPLFSPGLTSSTGPAFVDVWLESQGGLPLVLDFQAIQHCAFQMRLYKQSLPIIREANPARFLQFHLPRLLFCIALYRFIEASDYRLLLRQAEDSLNGTPS